MISSPFGCFLEKMRGVEGYSGQEESAFVTTLPVQKLPVYDIGFMGF